MSYHLYKTENVEMFGNQWPVSGKTEVDGKFLKFPFPHFAQESTRLKISLIMNQPISMFLIPV